MDFAARWRDVKPDLAAPIEASAQLICDMLFSGQARSKQELTRLRRQLAEHLRVIARHKA